MRTLAELLTLDEGCTITTRRLGAGGLLIEVVYRDGSAAHGSVTLEAIDKASETNERTLDALLTMAISDVMRTAGSPTSSAFRKLIGVPKP